MANSVQFRTTANQFGSRDIEVIPTGRQFGNIGQNTAAGNADYGLTMVLDGDYQNWFLQTAESNSGAARLLGGDGQLVRNTLLGQIDIPLDYEIGLDITAGPSDVTGWCKTVMLSRFVDALSVSLTLASLLQTGPPSSTSPPRPASATSAPAPTPATAAPPPTVAGTAPEFPLCGSGPARARSSWWTATPPTATPTPACGAVTTTS